MPKLTEEQQAKQNATARLRGAHRRGKLTEEQIARLEAIGFEFEAKPAKRAVVCYETGEVFESLTAAAKVVGIASGAQIKLAIEKGRKAGGYHWYYADEPKPDPSEFKKKGRAVVCYETGEVFESGMEAVRAKGLKSVTSITYAVEKGGLASGCHWYYADEPKPDPSEFKNPQVRPVVCHETGEVFENMKSAAKAIGLTTGSVSRAVKNSIYTCAGFHWRYATEEEVTQLRNETPND